MVAAGLVPPVSKNVQKRDREKEIMVFGTSLRRNNFSGKTTAELNYHWSRFDHMFFPETITDEVMGLLLEN